MVEESINQKTATLILLLIALLPELRRLEDNSPFREIQ